MMKDVIAEMIEVLRRHRVEAVIDTAELKVCSGEISFCCKGFPLKDGKTRRKEERAEAATLFMLSKDVSDANMWAASNFIRGAEWADKTMIERACRCFCDDICDKGRVGMCYHKHDGQQQVKNSFKYNECNELKLIRNAMEE